MGRPRKNKDATGTASADPLTMDIDIPPVAEMASAETTADGAGKSSPPGPRLTVGLTPDGRIDLDSIQERTKDKLKTALNDPALSGALGLKPKVTAALTQEQIATAAMMIDVLGRVNIWVGRMMGHDPKLAERYLGFGPDESAHMAPVAARVLNRYASSWAQEHMDEITLMVGLGTLIHSKYVALAAAEAKTESTAAAA